MHRMPLMTRRKNRNKLIRTALMSAMTLRNLNCGPSDPPHACFTPAEGPPSTLIPT